MSEIKVTNTTVQESLELLQLNPETVSMWPDTPAWDALFLLIAIAALYILFKQIRKYRQSKWKREAMEDATQALKASNADAWFTLIKRVHLVHRTRKEVANLSDASLITPLCNLKVNPINQEAKAQLLSTHYRPEITLPESTNQVIFNAFKAWVQTLPYEPKLTNSEN